MNIYNAVKNEFGDDCTLSHNYMFIKITFGLSVKITVQEFNCYLSIRYPFFMTSYIIYLFNKKKVDQVIGKLTRLASENDMMMQYVSLSYS